MRGDRDKTPDRPLVVHVDDLAPGVLAQLEEDGLVMLDEAHISPLDPLVRPARVVRLHDLIDNAALTRREQREEQTLVDQLGLNATVADVLAASHSQVRAGDWTIDRALHWLAENREKHPTRGGLANAFKTALATANFAESRVLSEAVLRDRALDTYERLLEKRVTSTMTELAKEREMLNQRLGQLQQDLATVQQQEQTLAKGLENWMANKRHIETQWAGVINLLIPGAGNSLVGQSHSEGEK